MIDSIEEQSQKCTISITIFTTIITRYGTSNVVFVSETSNSVVGSVTPSLQVESQSFFFHHVSGFHVEHSLLCFQYTSFVKTTSDTTFRTPHLLTKAWWPRQSNILQAEQELRRCLRQRLIVEVLLLLFFPFYTARYPYLKIYEQPVVGCQWAKRGFSFWSSVMNNRILQSTILK